MDKHRVLLVILMAAAYLLAACGAVFPISVATPLPPEAIGTEIVETQTAIAALTVTNALPPTNTLRPSRTPRPTETPRPTYTPSITPSPTVTFVITIPAIIHSVHNVTPTGGVHAWRPLEGYQAANGCDLISVIPKWGEEFQKGADFDASWTFVNYGPYNWNEAETDFYYISGEKMNLPPTKLIYDLANTVYVGERITITIDMEAPSKTGQFTTTWQLHEAERLYCRVSIMIQVK